MACWRAPLGKMLAAALLVAGCAASAQGPVAVTVDLIDYRFVPTAVRFSEIGCVSSREPPLRIVMPVLVTGIHVFLCRKRTGGWP